MSPELEERLNELAATTCRGKEDLVREVVSTYLDEVTETRHMLDSRYADIRSGHAKAIDGEEAFALLRQKGKKRRNGPA